MTAHAELWERVDELATQAPSLAALRRHRLHLLEADRRRRCGQPVAGELRAAERGAAMTALAVPLLLGRMRAVIDGPLVVMKGPEAAASWARPASRPFKDLDVLTADAERAQSALLAAGFVEAEGGAAAYHLPPLAWPGLPLTIEVHTDLHYVHGLPVPSLAELFALARPSATGVPGVDGLEPSAHAVLLAVHAWAHGPLERLGQLVDVAAVLGDGDRAGAASLASRWGCPRLWQTTVDCLDALLGKGRAPLALRTLGRHLRRTGEPSVLAAYLARAGGPAWALPRRRALGGVRAELARIALPYEQESWVSQLRRTRRAALRAGRPLSEYRI